MVAKQLLTTSGVNCLKLYDLDTMRSCTKVLTFFFNFDKPHSQGIEWVRKRNLKNDVKSSLVKQGVRFIKPEMIERQLEKEMGQVS